ncbi:MAG: orotidine-5'-phosphate decarboxylase [Chloroflexota bacterium]
MSTFQEKLTAASRKNNSFLCVGLDPDPALMPVEDVLEFNRAIIDATADLVCCYKPNMAFYEALGLPGLEALQRTLEHIPRDIPLIADAKRGDIGSTAQVSARAMFQQWGFDAVTVNPYLGRDALEPFLEYADRGIFVLCHTSNPGAADFQELPLGRWDDQRPLYEQVALKAQEWNSRGNIGLVVGATYPQQLQTVRRLCPDMVILAPGIGAQGGDLENTVKYGVNARGEGLIINASRSVIFASRNKDDFAREARRAAQELRQDINRAREEAGR